VSEMDAQLLACARCYRRFHPGDPVVMAVPFVEQGPVVRMGDELLFHETCEPLPAGLRAVGRGTQWEIVEGLRRSYHPDVIEEDTG